MKSTKTSFQPLKGKTLALVFEKRSTRTRLSAEVAWSKLGGTTVFLGKDDIHLGQGETVQDTVKVLSRMIDCILARVNSTDTLTQFVANSQVPVVNGLCDHHHPLQILADLITMKEAVDPNNKLSLREALNGIRVAWIGDSNNVCNELMTTLPRFGVHFAICHPKEYPIDSHFLQSAASYSSEVTVDAGYVTTCKDDVKGLDETGGTLHLSHTPFNVLDGARFVVTDTWISMGQEKEKFERLKIFNGYQVTHDLLQDGNVHPDWQFLHCLPRKPEEVADDVFESDRSLVWEEAENRVHTVKAVFHWLFAHVN